MVQDNGHVDELPLMFNEYHEDCISAFPTAKINLSKIPNPKFQTQNPGPIKGLVRVTLGSLPKQCVTVGFLAGCLRDW